MDQRNAAQRLRDIIELQLGLDWNDVMSIEFSANGTADVTSRLPVAELGVNPIYTTVRRTFRFSMAGTESRKVGHPNAAQPNAENAFNEPVERTLGQVAYEEYADKMGMSSVLGDTLPLWPHVRSDVQRGWEAAADAVRRSVTPPKAEETVPAPVLDPRQGGKSARQQTEQDAWDRMHPPGC